MTSAHRYSLPSQNESFRLPSLKDLNFQYRSPNGAAPQPQPPQDSANAQQDHAPPTRHASSWGRSNQNPPPSNPSITSLQSHPHQQHTPPLSAGGHENVVPKVEYPSKHENGGYAHPGLPLSAQVTPVPGSVNTGRSEDSSHSPNNSKRARTTTNLSTSSRDVRASHPYAPPQYASYPPTSQPPAASPSYHQMSSNMATQSNHSAQPAPPPPHEQMHQHSVPVSTHPGYGPPYQYMQRQPPVMHQQHPSNPYPSPGLPPSAPPPQGPWGQTHPQPQHPPPQHHHQPPPQPPQQQQQHVQHPSHIHQQQPPPVATNPAYMVPQHHMQQPPPVSAPQHPQHPQQHPPPQQQQPSQYQQPPPPPQQLQQPSFARTTAIVPTNIDTRQQYATGDPARNDTMAEINNHCSILYGFANRYAQIQQSNPNIQPTESELLEMSQRAMTVVRLLEELRRLNAPEGEQSREAPSNAMQQSPDDPRPPKRPWEDIDDTTQPTSETNNFTEQQQYSSVDVKPQSTAEQDMELIRTKRATSTAGSTGPTGQPKSKYRKRSRATPPGKCHSCNIKETPEWRRGPDGARTLCNACGLHYAKLMRKRDKNANGETPVIDMETLRASARAADIADKSSRPSKQASRSHQSEPASPMDSKQAAQHHQSSFQLVTPMATDPSPSTMAAETSRAQTTPSQQHQSMPPPGSLPPPPWATSAPSSGRVYPAPEHLQHQSFMRGSQHTPANHAPSR